MGVPGSVNNLLGAGGAPQYLVERSIRLNSADSAFLSRTPASAGNRKTWTWAGWVKRSDFTSGTLLSCTTGGTDYTFGLVYFYQNRLEITGTGAIFRSTNRLFRDPSAWYHIVVAFDTTQTTGADRIKVYVNGSQETFSSATNPDLNGDYGINQAGAHDIGRYFYVSGQAYFNGYLADIHFIDGQALTPSSFTEVSASTGQLIPKAYTGSFGTNGFWLKFSDNSASTSTTLGKDYSGNSNNWTPNNLSVTAGAGNDSLVDTPTSYGTDTGAGGEVRGNYATLNPLAQPSGTYSNGNLEYIGPAAFKAAPSTILLPTTGKWYAEATLKAAPANNVFGGVYAGFGVIAPSAVSGWSYNTGTSFYVTDTGFYSNYNTGSSGSVGTFTTGTVVGLAVNRDTNQVTVYQDGVSKATVTLGITSGADLYFFSGSYDGNYGQMALNFGQRPFAYTAPSGFKALCDTNLAAPVVAKPSTMMDVTLYTGNGGTQTISGLGFSPDFVWFKNRAGANSYVLLDIVRGGNKIVYSNQVVPEVTSTGGISSWNADGFTVVHDGVNGNSMNISGGSIVAWNWDAGSSTASNTQGSITSQVRANASAGFSIVTFTGNGSNPATVGHGLGVAPRFIIFRRRDLSVNWFVYAGAIGNGVLEGLNTTSAYSSAATIFNQTAPSSTVFSLGNTDGNANGGTYVAYCFAPVAGYSSFGSYTGNGSADGPFVFLGFRPAVVIVKMSSSTGNWTILDDKREGYNVDNDPLYPNLTNAEGTTDLIDITSNGFKVRTTDATFNTNTGTYIYAAWASSPFAYARAR